MSLEELLEIRMAKADKVQWIANRPEAYPRLIALALSPQQPHGWRAAWLLRDTMHAQDARVQPHLNQLLDTLPTLPEGHQRELLKVVIQLELNDEQEGRLFDQCIGIWERVGKQPSIRSVALRILATIAAKYPELIGELDHLGAQEYMAPLSPGIRNVCEKVFAELRSQRC